MKIFSLEGLLVKSATTSKTPAAQGQKRKTKYRRDEPQRTTRLYADWLKILGVVAKVEGVAAVDILDEILSRSDLRDRATKGVKGL